MTHSRQSPNVADVVAINESSTEQRAVDERSLALIYDEVAGDLDRQFTQVEHLNGRAPQILGLGGVILGVMVALRPPTADILVSLLTVGALLIYALAAALSLAAWQIIAWRSDPKTPALWEEHRDRSATWIRHQIILNRIESRGWNAARIERKVKLVRWAQRLLAAEILYLVLLLILRPYIS